MAKDQMAETRPYEGGMSVLELLVAMFLLAVVLLGTAASFPLALHAVASAARQTTMAWLARDTLELARRTAYGAIPGLDSSGFVEVPSHRGLERSIAVAPGSPSLGTTTITVVLRAPSDPSMGAMTMATVVTE